MNDVRAGHLHANLPDAESRALLSALLDASPGALIVDSASRITFLNKALASFFGCLDGDCIGLTLAQFSPELEIALSPNIGAVLASAEPQDGLEVSLSPANATGEQRHWLASIRPLSPDVAGACILFRDVTDLWRTQHELQDKTSILETLNRIGGLLTAELDIDKLVQTVTDAATQVSGAQFGAFFYNVVDERGESYTLYALSGAMRESFSKFPTPRNTEVFGPTFRGEGPICLANVRKDPRYGKMEPYRGMPAGHLPVTSYLAVPVVARSGEVLGGLFFGHEDEGVFTQREVELITGLAAQTAIAMDNARLFKSLQQKTALAEEARREAEAANRSKDEFLAVVSHELRTPLTSMRGWLHLIRTGKLDEKAHEQAMDALERSGRAQTQLIDDLLDISRVIHGKLHLNTVILDPARLIREAIDIVRPAADAREIAVRFQDAANEVRVAGDGERLRQVIWNLLSNAVKFTAHGGSIEVHLQRKGNFAEIRVRDSGIGIESDFLPHVFERFRQADTTSTRVHNGLGLGLSIVRHLVEMHGGTVGVESDGRDKGATFIVDLPLATETGPGAAASEPSGSPGDEMAQPLNGLRILLVEDEDDTRLLLEILLKKNGAEVQTAKLAGEGFEIVQAWKPGLLVSDIGMPGEDGCSLIERVRALPSEQGGNLRAIALTSYARAEDRMRILAAGFETNIPKPVELSELIAAIKILMRRK